MQRQITLFTLVSLLAMQAAGFRYALMVGANSGGTGTDSLRFAEKDAARFGGLLTELGGFEKDNVLILHQPDSLSLGRAFVEFRARLAGPQGESDNLFLFYYSGHSDERGLKLGRDRFSHAMLQRAFESVRAKIRIGVFDACQAGIFTRFKGGRISPPFYLEAQKRVTGQVIIASSAADERSQESDELQGSVFSHHLMNGLRGSGDASGDKRVTLNEAYQYAYKKTIETTALSRAGIQHPSYQFKICGEGDIVLTDLSTGKTGILFSENLEGKFLVLSRDYSDMLADFYKSRAKEIFISLSPGAYTVMKVEKDDILTCTAEIEPEQKYLLQYSDLKKEIPVINQIKGVLNNAYYSQASAPREKQVLELLDHNLSEIANQHKKSRKVAGGVFLGLATGLCFLIPAFDFKADQRLTGLAWRAAVSLPLSTIGIYNLLRRSESEKIYDRYTDMPQDNLSNIRVKTFYGENYISVIARREKMERLVGGISGLATLISGPNVFAVWQIAKLFQKSEMEERLEKYNAIKAEIMEVAPQKTPTRSEP